MSDSSGVALGDSGADVAGVSVSDGAGGFSSTMWGRPECGPPMLRAEE